ncbi:hypothetical protein P22_2404 [Propionispora sp. 2/2-37]|nr:hypothetical protein P22_2404 [Propionispora sp. 2/2-37]
MYVRPAWMLMVLAVLLGVLSIAANAALLAVSAFLISMAALHPPLSALSTAIVGVRFFGLARAVLRYLERYAAHAATLSLLTGLRTWVYARLEPLLPQRLSIQNGELLTMLVQDIEILKEMYLRLLAPPVVALIVLVMAGAGVLLGGGQSAMVYILITAYLVCGVVCPLAVYWWNRRQGRRYVFTQARLNGYLVDSINGMTELTAFQYKEQILSRIESYGAQLAKLQERSAMLTAATEAAGVFFTHLSVWGILLLAVSLVESGQLAGVYVAALVLGLQSSFEAVSPLVQAARFLPDSVAAGKRLVSLPPAPVTTGDLTTAVPRATDLLVENLNFRYQKGLPVVLKDVSFYLPAGKQIAIVGPSGAGKSSLIAALLRFGQYEGGKVFLGEMDSATLPDKTIREFFSVVPQQVYLFNASIRDNILLARPSASDGELESAVRQAALSNFIHSLPQGYDTLVGQHGQALSGGQRQRVGIARALLKDAPVLLLDEPYAQLDTVTGKAVYSALQQAIKGRSCMLITHQLTGLEAMDEILVIHEGKVAERGTMDELIQRNGLFKHLWTLERDVLPF